MTLDDDLPVPDGSDIEWTESEDPSDACTVTDNVLHCEFGDLGITTMEAITRSGDRGRRDRPR